MQSSPSHLSRSPSLASDLARQSSPCAGAPIRSHAYIVIPMHLACVPASLYLLLRLRQIYHQKLHLLRRPYIKLQVAMSLLSCWLAARNTMLHVLEHAGPNRLHRAHPKPQGGVSLGPLDVALARVGGPGPASSGCWRSAAP
jgi:hypothetical protein